MGKKKKATNFVQDFAPFQRVKVYIPFEDRGKLLLKVNLK